MNRTFSILCVATTSLIAVLAFGAAQGAETPRIGSPAPDFSVVDEQGTTHRLREHRGKLVVLEWTNPDCPYVQRHYRADTMEKLAEKFDTEVVWFAVNSSWDNTAEDTRTWKQSEGFAYATLQDSEGELGHLYGARTTPNMYVIDGEGILRYSGAIDDDPRGRADAPKNHVSSAIGAILASTDPDPAETRPYGCSVKYH